MLRIGLTLKKCFNFTRGTTRLEVDGGGTCRRSEWEERSQTHLARVAAPRSPLMSRWYPPCNGKGLAGLAKTSSLAKPSAKLRRGSGGQPTRSSPLLAGAGLPRLAYKEVVGRWSAETGDFLARLARGNAWKRRRRPCQPRLRSRRSHAAGANCSRSPPRAHLAPACSRPGGDACHVPPGAA